MEKEIDNIYNKRGYLDKDFALFHIKDKINLELEFHYHDFYKVILFISGKVTYLIEGRSYRLKAGDILLVSNNQLHKPIIDTSESYERIVVWIDPIFFKKNNSIDCKLECCFQRAAGDNLNLLRQDPSQLLTIKKILLQVEEAMKDREFGSHILTFSLFLQFLIYINRMYLGIDEIDLEGDLTFDSGICSVISYINSNIDGDLSIDTLASNFYLNKYYLMHKFKKETGYTIHNYILQKRLIKAKILIKEGNSIGEASLNSGFKDYSNFMRAFKKMFGISPKKFADTIKNY